MSRTEPLAAFRTAPPEAVVAELPEKVELLTVTEPPSFSTAPPLAAESPEKVELPIVSVPRLSIAPPNSVAGAEPFSSVRLVNTASTPLSTRNKRLALFPLRAIAPLVLPPSMVMTPVPAPLSSNWPPVRMIVWPPRLGSKVIVSEVPAAASRLAWATACHRESSPATLESAGLLTTKFESMRRFSSISRVARRAATRTLFPVPCFRPVR